MKIAIIKYNAGNIQSVKYAFERLGVDVEITDDPETIKAADKVVFPGVGEAKSAMQYLKDNGMVDLIMGLKQPVLGICIGMQLMCEHSEENDTDCMGIFPVNVKMFPRGKEFKGEALKIPHMGWNNMAFTDFPLFQNLGENPYIYYVHSFYADIDDDYTVATTEYASKYSAALHKDNFYALQFHPEKSGAVGQKILKNFIEL